MQSPITPTVGRKVWFFATNTQVEPHDATVVAVNPDTTVNLHIAHPDSALVSFYANVPHCEGFPHYQWMPYQISQQVKSETTSKAEATS